MIDKAAKILKQAEFVAVLTGAGISKDSGIPTFRGKDGLWRNFSPEELATPQAFQKNPKLVWEWYNWRRSIIYRAKPNAAHISLVKLEEIKKGNLWIITQNVDGLHIKAGNKNVIELHGNIWSERCIACGFKRYNECVYEYENLPPKCPECGNLLRPDVVWFGEPVRHLEESYQIVREADVLLYIGTSAVVYPAASLIELSIASGKYVIEINYEKTHLSDYVSVSLIGRAAEILPHLVQKL